MNSHYDPLFAPFDDDAGNITENYPEMTKEDFVRMVADRLAICAEQRPLVRLPAATRRSTTATLIKVFR